MIIDSSNQVSRIYHMNDTSSAVSANSSVSVKSKTTTDKVTISADGLNAESKWKQISKKYDPTNISYNELSNMSTGLLENGLITSQEGLALLVPPSIDFDPNEKYDAVAKARQSVAFDQSLGVTQSIDAQLRVKVLDILEKIQNVLTSARHIEA